MKFALIDDHALVRDGFKRLIETQHEWQVVVEANTYLSAVQSLSNTLVDLVIIDISLPDKNGIELAKYLLANKPDLKCIIVSMYDQNPYVSNALEVGVKGYISKRSASDELLKGIEVVLAGNTYLSQDVINKLQFGHVENSTLGVSQLTERELDILPLLATGMNAKQISQQLNIMPKTAHVHRANIYKKLNVTNNFDLLKIALSEGVITMEELTL
ncbi:DNA-binding response regulator [Thalassotalea insulae]|uniref:DNA-binding response regulator n=1 Tax=Thalassotalea insulae TaxID=2056778 RepID=A0ABQ6GSY1_9GAMM|nr:response regulator transcription factor [Thalassotalea insulae]GLX79033.1 DNA-binding response regulator [Thalassotalea insulae]